jgi:hypothetical protein
MPYSQVLSSGSGAAIAVVVGGAAESLEAAPGTMDLTLCNRRGFVRQVRALEPLALNHTVPYP